MTLPVGESGAFTELYLIVFESLVSVVLENLDKFFKNLLSLALVVFCFPLATAFEVTSNEVLR